MRGAMTQLQVVHALLLRETRTRFGANHLGYIWALLQPAAWIGLFYGFYTVFGRLSPPGTSPLAFLTTGIVPYSTFRETSSRCLSAIDSNKGLLFYPQVKPLDLVIARAILEAATHIVILVLLLSGAALIEGTPRVDNLIEVLLGMGLASGLGASMGLVCCGLSVYTPTLERVYPTVMRLFFWASAVFHPVESVPNAVRDVLLLNPLTHVIELIRDGWFPGYVTRHVDVGYCASWILVLGYFGLSLERMARRRLEIS